MKKLLLFAGVACFISLNANAADIKPYVGFDLGYSHAELAGIWDKYNFNDNFAVANINVGAKFNQYIGIEGSFQASSKAKTYGIDLSYTSWGVDVLGYIPVSRNVELFGSAGIGEYTLKAESYGVKIDTDETAFRAGIGAQYNITDNWAVRGMVRHAFIDSEDVDSLTELTAGVRYSF